MTDEQQQEHPWPECVAHPMAKDEDCEWCQAELAGMEEHLEKLKQLTLNLNIKLAQMHNGVPYIETQSAVPMIAVEVMIDTFIPERRSQLAFWINFTSRLAQHMEKVRQDAVKAQLTQGVNSVPPNIIRDLGKH